MKREKNRLIHHLQHPLRGFCGWDMTGRMRGRSEAKMLPHLFNSTVSPATLPPGPPMWAREREEGGKAARFKRVESDFYPPHRIGL